jgi:hypothetical protein
MATSYHNTTGVSQNEASKRNRNAKTQEDLVYDIMKEHKKLTKREVHLMFTELPGKIDVPEVSIGRALSNLTKWGILKYTNERIIGRYGAMVGFYEIIEGAI